jgi:hypothetical protein
VVVAAGAFVAAAGAAVGVAGLLVQPIGTTKASTRASSTKMATVRFNVVLMLKYISLIYSGDALTARRPALRLRYHRSHFKHPPI